MKRQPLYLSMLWSLLLLSEIRVKVQFIETGWFGLPGMKTVTSITLVLWPYITGGVCGGAKPLNTWPVSEKGREKVRAPPPLSRAHSAIRSTTS